MADSAGRSNRNSLLIRLVLAAGLLILLFGVSIWLIHGYIARPQQAALAPSVARTVGVAAPAPAAVMPVGSENPAFTGKVTDARTHQPIVSFTVQLAFSGPKFNQRPFFREPAKPCSDGRYSLLSGLDFAGQLPPVWIIRIEARGYLPAVSAPLSGSISRDFELQPGRDLRGRVFDGKGAPVPDATVAVVIPTVLPTEISDGKLESKLNTQTATDAQGQYDLPPQSGRFIVFATSEAGYAQADQEGIAKSADIQLIPWGRIKGQAFTGTTIAAKEPIGAYAEGEWGPPPPLNLPQVLHSHLTNADANGEFHFDHIVPGLMQVGRFVIAHSGRTVVTMLAGWQPVRVNPNQTVTVKIGGAGRPVTGRLRIPSLLANSTDYIVSGAAVSVDDPPPPRMPDRVKNGTPAEQQAWMQLFALTPAGEEYLCLHWQSRTSPPYPLETDENGRFILNDVLPGDYRISVRVRLLRGGLVAPPTQAYFTMPNIPGGVSDEPLQIPDIHVNG